ncbi:sulfatase-like hydrolase/transferase [Akkermansiaceae bacterium]|nr:sulfatase-like hydrolase/transferase [Akkermansiaceae bacterium]
MISFVFRTAILCLALHGGAGGAVKPNILVILADDLGIECLSTYGGITHKTPNIARLATQGMRFTHCFSNPTCSPSRATLLTGRYSFAHGMKQVIWNLETHADMYLDTRQPSFARQLKGAGYATAIAGKWQLSFLNQRNEINGFGFDQYQCWQIFTPSGERTSRFEKPHFNRNGTLIAAEIADRYGPDVDVAFLIGFMKASHAEGKPFMAYHTCLLPHYPWVPTPESEDQGYRLPDPDHKGDPKYFPDMVAHLDDNVGKLMRALDEMGVAENTVLVFLSDNGTDRDLVHRLDNGKDIEGGKGTMTDRGTRVPLIVRWPGRIKAGSACGDLIDFSDMLPTLCEIGGAPLPAGKIHGRSFMPQLLGEAGNPRDWVYIQDKEQRHVRGKRHILDSNGKLRPVTELWDDPAAAVSGKLTDHEEAELRKLKAVFGDLDGKPE